MFSKIAVALNDLPESQRALRTAIGLVQNSKAGLATVPMLEDLPAYTSFEVVDDPTPPGAMQADRRRIQVELHDSATRFSPEHGVAATSAIIEGRETRSILHYLREHKADLLVIGLHRHDFLFAPSMEFCV